MAGWLPRECLTVLQTIETGQVDPAGVPITRETPRQWAGCRVEPASTVEDTVRARRVETSLTVSGDLVPWLRSGDRVLRVEDGTEVAYRVDGTPRHYRTVRPHTEAVLVAWAGV